MPLVQNVFRHHFSLQASSPIWTSEASLARTRERAAKPRGAEERRACNDLSKNFICTSLRRREIPLAEKWRSGKQSWLITGQAGTSFVSVSSLVLRGIRLVPTTCFSPQSRRGGSFDLVLAKRILRAEDKSDRGYSSCGRKMKTFPHLYSFVSRALFKFSSENKKSESEERFKRPAQALPSNVGLARLNSTG